MTRKVKLSKTPTFNILAIRRILWETLFLPEVYIFRNVGFALGCRVVRRRRLISSLLSTEDGPRTLAIDIRVRIIRRTLSFHSRTE